MGFKQPDEMTDENDPATDISGYGALDFQDDDLGLPEGEGISPNDSEIAKKSVAKNPVGTRFSLKARRAIEDHLEERRLRKELDYLYGDGFAEDGEDEKTPKS